MSIHRSLVPASKLRRHRNVLTRAERLDTLKKEDRHQEDQSIFGLPKVRNIMLKAKPKKKEAAEAAAGAVPAAGAAAPGAGAPAEAGKGGAPAKGAAPAAGAKAAAPAKKEEKKK